MTNIYSDSKTDVHLQKLNNNVKKLFNRTYKYYYRLIVLGGGFLEENNILMKNVRRHIYLSLEIPTLYGFNK